MTTSSEVRVDVAERLAKGEAESETFRRALAPLNRFLGLLDRGGEVLIKRLESTRAVNPSDQ